MPWKTGSGFHALQFCALKRETEPRAVRTKSRRCMSTSTNSYYGTLFPDSASGRGARTRALRRRLERPGRRCDALHAQIADQLTAMVGRMHVGAHEKVHA